MPWTKPELQAAMRAVGWERMSGPGSVYHHPETGHQINLGSWEHGRFTWETYAEKEQIPPKEKPIALTGLAAELWWELSNAYSPQHIQATCANVQRLESNHANLVEDIARLQTAIRAAGLVDDDLLAQLARGPEYVVGYLIDYFEAFVPNGAD